MRVWGSRNIRYIAKRRTSGYRVRVEGLGVTLIYALLHASMTGERGGAGGGLTRVRGGSERAVQGHPNYSG